MRPARPSVAQFGLHWLSGILDRDGSGIVFALCRARLQPGIHANPKMPA
jgi:hypothetical protein